MRSATKYPAENIAKLVDGLCKYTICVKQRSESTEKDNPGSTLGSIQIEDLLQSNTTIDISKQYGQWQLKPLMVRGTAGNCVASFGTLGKAIDFAVIAIDIVKIDANINHATINTHTGEKYYIIREE